MAHLNVFQIHDQLFYTILLYYQFLLPIRELQVISDIFKGPISSPQTLKILPNEVYF